MKSTLLRVNVGLKKPLATRWRSTKKPPGIVGLACDRNESVISHFPFVSETLNLSELVVYVQPYTTTNWVEMIFSSKNKYVLSRGIQLSVLKLDFSKVK